MRLVAAIRAAISLEARPMIELTAAEGGARLVSFLYYVAAARVLAPAGFGVVTYTITLSTLGFALMQVLGLSIGREIGAARGDPERIRQIVGSSIGISAGVTLATLVGAGIAAAAGITGTASVLGLLVVLAGRSVFEAYYAIGRGLGDTRRMAAVYVTGSLAQLVAFLALAAVTTPSPLATLLVFGVSSALPVLVIETTRPFIRGIGGIERRVARELWIISLPILGAHLLYLAWANADLVWVQQQLGSHATGLYGAAKNVAAAFLVIPAGVAGALVPRVAQLHTAGDAVRARRLVKRTATTVLALSGLGAAVVVALRTPLMTVLYDDQYAPAAPALAGLAVGGAFYAGTVTLTSAAVGWRRPLVYTGVIALAAVAEVGYLLLVGGSDIAVAAWANAGASGVALLAAAGWLWTHPLRTPPSPARLAEPGPRERAAR